MIHKHELQQEIEKSWMSGAPSDQLWLMANTIVDGFLRSDRSPVRHNEAEDVAQATLVRLFARWPRMMTARNPHAYITRCAQTTGLNHIRSESRRRAALERLKNNAGAR